MRHVERPITRDEYEEWRSSAVTTALFEFFKREAYAYRAILASADLMGTDAEVGQKYKMVQVAINCYDALDNLEFEDLSNEAN